MVHIKNHQEQQQYEHKNFAKSPIIQNYKPKIHFKKKPEKKTYRPISISKKTAEK